MEPLTRENDPEKVAVIDRCCSGLIRRIEEASGREVVAVVYDCYEDRGLFPPSGVMFRGYEHAAKELVERCIAETPVTDVIPIDSQEAAS